MKKLLLIALLIVGCEDGGGSCAGGGMYGTSCLGNDWDEDECRDFDEQQVNGGGWTFSKDSCDDRGYTVYCSDIDTYLLPSNTYGCP